MSAVMNEIAIQKKVLCDACAADSCEGCIMNLSIDGKKIKISGETNEIIDVKEDK